MDQTYTHAGKRYMLGYTANSYGIWDKDSPDSPYSSFPLSDVGWSSAWDSYMALEPDAVDLPAAPAGSAAGTPVSTVAIPTPPGSGQYVVQTTPGVVSSPPTQKVSGAWWLAPILFGLVGGLIAWGVNKAKDPTVAKQMLITGIAINVVYLLITQNA